MAPHSNANSSVKAAPRTDEPHKSFSLTHQWSVIDSKTKTHSLLEHQPVVNVGGIIISTIKRRCEYNSRTRTIKRLQQQPQCLLPDDCEPPTRKRNPLKSNSFPPAAFMEKLLRQSENHCKEKFERLLCAESDIGTSFAQRGYQQTTLAKVSSNEKQCPPPKEPETSYGVELRQRSSDVKHFDDKSKRIAVLLPEYEQWQLCGTEEEYKQFKRLLQSEHTVRSSPDLPANDATEDQHDSKYQVKFRKNYSPRAEIKSAKKRIARRIPPDSDLTVMLPENEHVERKLAAEEKENKQRKSMNYSRVVDQASGFLESSCKAEQETTTRFDHSLSHIKQVKLNGFSTTLQSSKCCPLNLRKSMEHTKNDNLLKRRF